MLAVFVEKKRHILCFLRGKYQDNVKKVKKCLVFFLRYTIIIMIELLGEVCGGRKYDSIKCI